MSNKTLLQKIKSNYFAVRVTLFAVLFLAPNIFFVFWTISPEYQLNYLREFFAAGVALLLSGYIMYYTIKKDETAAGWFYSFEVFIALCNYWIRLMFNDEGVFIWNWFILPATAFAFMLPWAVKRSAQSIDDEVNEEDINKLKQNNEILKSQILDFEHNETELHNQVAKLTDDMQNYHTTLLNLDQQIKKEWGRAESYKNQIDVMRQFIQPAPVATLETLNDITERNGAELSTPVVDQVPDPKAEALNKEEKVSTWKDDDDIFNAGAVKFNNVKS